MYLICIFCYEQFRYLNTSIFWDTVGIGKRFIFTVLLFKYKYLSGHTDQAVPACAEIQAAARISIWEMHLREGREPLPHRSANAMQPLSELEDLGWDMMNPLKLSLST